MNQKCSEHLMEMPASQEMQRNFCYSSLKCPSKIIFSACHTQWKLLPHFKFCLKLFLFFSYKLRIESMLLKEEFASNMSYLEPSINSMIVAGEGKFKFQISSCCIFSCLEKLYKSHLLCSKTDLMTNKPLQEVLYMVVRVGNFLNSVSF